MPMCTRCGATGETTETGEGGECLCVDCRLSEEHARATVEHERRQWEGPPDEYLKWRGPMGQGGEQLKRFTLADESLINAKLVEHPEGDWVRFEDYAAAVTGLWREVQRWKNDYASADHDRMVIEGERGRLFQRVQELTSEVGHLLHQAKCARDQAAQPPNHHRAAFRRDMIRELVQVGAHDWNANRIFETAARLAEREYGGGE